MPVILQYPSLILPATWAALTDVELVADALTHVSYEFPVEYLHEKTVHIMATEVVVGGGIPGNLNAWIELSPYPTANTPFYPVPYPVTGIYWSAIGGGGGALAPTAPLIIVGTGVNNTIHTELMSWSIHSQWARVIVQTPVPAVTGDLWAVQIYYGAKSP